MMRLSMFTCAYGCLLGCGLWVPDGAEDEPDGGDAAQDTADWQLGEVRSWPRFDLDCDVAWDGAIDVAQTSGQFDTVGFAVSNWYEGAVAPNPRISVVFSPAATTYAVDRRELEDPWQLELQVQVDNTSYYNRATHDGQTRGEVIVHAFDAVRGIADVEFVDVKLRGDDAVYAGDYRCGIDGRLEVELGRLDLGEPCREDHECGGDHSMRVCDFDTLTCAEGCHEDVDCPAGQACDDEACG